MYERILVATESFLLTMYKHIQLSFIYFIAVRVLFAIIHSHIVHSFVSNHIAIYTLLTHKVIHTCMFSTMLGLQY